MDVIKLSFVEQILIMIIRGFKKDQGPCYKDENVLFSGIVCVIGS